MSGLGPSPAQRPHGRWRLLAPALLAWGCSAGAILCPGGGLVLAWVGGLGAAAVLLCACWRRRLPLRLLAVATGVVLLLGCQIAGGERVRADPGLTSAADEGRILDLSVTVDSYPSRSGHTGVEAGEGAHSARVSARGRVAAETGTVPVVLWATGAGPGGPARAREPPGSSQPLDWKRVGPGSELLVRGTVVRLEPGSSAAFGVRVRSVQRAVASLTGLDSWSAWFSERLLDTRETLIAEARLVEGAELLPGFAMGNTDLVPGETAAKLRAASLLHLLAVSGANCALVTGAVVWCASWLRVPRRARVILAGAALAGFLSLVGPDQSVQRAVLMAAVILVARFGGRGGHALPALGAAIIALLLADPWQALAPGFALSVAATAGILLMSGRIEAWLARALPLPRLIRVPLSVAITAEAAVAPLILTLDEGLPLVGVIANLVAGLAAPLGTGIGLLAALVLPAAQPLGHALLEAGALPARWIVVTAELASAFPLARIPWPKGWGGAVLLGAVLGLAWSAIAVSNAGRARRRPWGAVPLLTPGRIAVVAALAAAAIGGFAGPTVVSPLASSLATPSDWRILACDIGQGDAIALRSGGPGGPVMLVDTGEDEAKLRTCLDRFGVGRIAMLVLTHDDRDHVGALGAVAERCDEAMIAIPSRDLIARRPLVERLDHFRLKYTIGSAGRAGNLGAEDESGGIEWEVLAPAADSRPTETNAASQILRVRVAGVTVLLLADSGKEQHRRLLRSGADLSADVVKVAHHGSSDQDPALLEATRARLGLISVGADNAFGHPTEGALGGLAHAGIRALRTDQYGSIAVSGSPGTLEVWVERPDGARGGRDEYLPHPKRGGAGRRRAGRVRPCLRCAIGFPGAHDFGTESEKSPDYPEDFGRLYRAAARGRHCRAHGLPRSGHRSCGLGRNFALGDPR